MVNENLIPKENIYKTEIVQELKQEIPSYEKFMRTYNANEAIVNSYEHEFTSYDNLSVEKGYGPMARLTLKIQYNVLFKLPDGSFANKYKTAADGLEGVREFLRKIESGEIQVVFMDNCSRRSKVMEDAVKECLRKKIRDGDPYLGEWYCDGKPMNCGGYEETLTIHDL